jgi:Ca-activated chloride channel family protein
MDKRALALFALLGLALACSSSGGSKQAGTAASPRDQAVATPAQASPYGAGVMARRAPAASYEMREQLRALGYGVPPGFDTEAYARIDESEFQASEQHPLSTFSIDVDTASYANVRRFLSESRLPPADAVRIEELVNYFPYAYEPPAGDAPFAVHTEVMGCPWEPSHRLVRIGLKAKEIPQDERPPSNLVFLLDVSGSMAMPDKLPLVKSALRLLVEQLRESDRVAIVVYAGNSGLVLPGTSGDRKAEILAAIDRLEAGGSTNGGSGLELAYRIAAEGFRPGATNRVILATDGDFNVGVTSHGELTRLIEAKAKSGVFLSVLGFGTGNLKDDTMEQLADRGNGNYAYIDTEREAKKALVEQLTGTLLTVAKDVKIQVEWNPARAASYRLVGYENRRLAPEDFRDDSKDAGEIGAGHTVTALYEVVPAGAAGAGRPVDPLKYQAPREPAAKSDELLTVKLRYKSPEGRESIPLEYAVLDPGASFASASADSRFAAAVAAFGMVLRESPHRGIATLDSVIAMAEDAGAERADPHRREFIELARKAKALAEPAGS